MKKTVLWILLDLIFLIVFNTVFFVAGGTEHPASVWISYGFIHFSYIMVILTPFLIRKSSSAAVFGFSLYSISSAYFMIEFVVGLIFVLLRLESYKPALIVQIIIAGLYAIMLISNLLANESTADSIEKHEAEVDYIKTTSAKVKGLMDRMSDKKANKQIEKLYDMLHASPAKSSPAVKDIEIEIADRVEGLEVKVRKDLAEDVIKICDEIISLAEERNRTLQANQ